jgi:hypothetical protein
MDVLVLVAAAAAAVPPLKRMARIARDKLDRKNAKEKLARAEAHALQALVGACGGTTSSSSVEIQSRQKKKAVTDAVPPWATRIC